MHTKLYYSDRTGKNPMPKDFNLDTIRNLFLNFFTNFKDEGFFEEHFGHYSVDDAYDYEGFQYGKSGLDFAGFLLCKLRKKNLYPFHKMITNYSEEDMFDVIEFLYEYCSMRIYDLGNGISYDRDEGRKKFRNDINGILALYNEGYELSPQGEILSLASDGLNKLCNAPIQTSDPKNISKLVEAAINKFHRYKSSIDERKDAVINLADVLEGLRPQLKKVILTSDENDLFNIANNFGIRHNNKHQKTDYDKAIFYSWIFYYYLATIHATTRLIEKNKKL